MTFNPVPKPTSRKTRIEPAEYALTPKPARLVSDAIRKAAKGEDCTLRMPWCSNDPEQTVFCHIRAFGMSGVGQKPLDIHGYFGCHACHMREVEAGWDNLLRAMMITQTRLFSAGIIEVKK